MQRPSVRNSINYSNKRLAYSRQWGNRKVDIEYNGKKRVSGKMNKPFRHHILQGGQNHPICKVLLIMYVSKSFKLIFCHFPNETPPTIYKLSFFDALIENLYHLLTNCLIVGTL